MLPKRHKSKNSKNNSKTLQRVAAAEFKQPLLPEDLQEDKRRVFLFTTLQKKKKRQACALFIYERKIKIGCFLFFLTSGSLTVSYLAKLQEWNNRVNGSFVPWQQSYQKYLNGTCPSENHPFWNHPEQNTRMIRFERLYDYCGNSHKFAIQTIASLSSFFPEICIGLMNQLCEAYKEYEGNVTGRVDLSIEFIGIALAVALVVVPSSIFVCRRLGRVNSQEIAALDEILIEPGPAPNPADLDVSLPKLESKVNEKHNELIRKRCLEVLDPVLEIEPKSLLGICQEIFEFAGIAIEQPVDLQVQKTQPSHQRVRFK